MKIEELATVTIDRTNDVVTVQIAGEIDSSNAHGIGELITSAETGARACIVDLTLLTYLDSAALTMLHRFAQLPTPLLLVTPAGSRATRLIEIGGLDTILTTPRTMESALAAL